MPAVLQKQVGNGGPITLVTTAETLIAYSGKCELAMQTMRLIIKAWLQIVYGTAATGIILRIRRGNGTTGAVVAGGNTETAGVAAAAVADLSIQFAEQIINQEFSDYSLTAQQVAATGNATANLGQIEVEAING